MLRKKGIFLYLILYLMSFNLDEGKAEFYLGAPDYESEWRPLRAQNWGGCKFSFKHNFADNPRIVDVQVKSLDEPNMNFKFPAVGGCPRDDNLQEQYGGVCYLYNDNEVIVSAPVATGGHDSGWAIYTVNNNLFKGSNNQSSLKVSVKVRAWRSTSLPFPSFVIKGIYINARSTKDGVVFQEIEHGLGNYPVLANVRIRIPDGQYKGYFSDAVGANIVTITSDPTSKPGYAVYGFNDQNIRVWFSTTPKSFLFRGSDGWRLPVENHYGHLQIFVWEESRLPVTHHSQTQLGPSVANEQFDMALAGNTEDRLVRVWAESMTGPNLGYRFPGSGSLAYVDRVEDPVCSYGGLTYSYSMDTLRFWRPTGVNNAGIICVSDGFGFGHNSQRDLDAKILINVFIFPKAEGTTIVTSTKRTTSTTTPRPKVNITGEGNPEWKEIENVCVYTKL